MKNAFVSYAQIAELLPLLVEQKLVIKHSSSNNRTDEEYTLSSRGQQFIKNYFNVYKMLCNGDPSEIMPIRFLDIKKMS